MTGDPIAQGEIVRGEIEVVRLVLGATGISEVALDDEGWDSRVYVVDGGVAVFKFPRTPAVQRAYRTEVAMLRLAASCELPLSTPRVRWVGPGLSYFGYEGLGGEAANLDAMAPARRGELGTAIGSFARALHALDLPAVRTIDVEAEIADFQSNWAGAAPIVATRVTPAERSRLDAFYGETMPYEMRRLGGDPVLCHGDLGPWNIVVDDHGTVGVIDFGDVCRRDRSTDLVGMYEPVALDAALAAYGDRAGLRDKIAVRARALPAMDVIFFAGKHDDVRLDVCIDRIRDLLLQ